MQLSFVVTGPPVPKERARVVSTVNAHGKRSTRGVTPSKTRAYEAHVAIIAAAARSHVPRWPWQDKAARFGIAIRVYRSRDSGDLDNYEKAIQDACDGVLWHDDSQIRRRGEGGIWACEKGKERVEIDVWTLEVQAAE